jgi:RAB6A-GEF complex partner protein 2
VGTPQPGAPSTTLGGLEWKVRLCLLVAVTTELAQSGTEAVKVKQMVRDGPRGEWGSSWRAPSGIAPMEKPEKVRPVQLSLQEKKQNARQSWAAFFTSSIIGASSERAFHDGDEGIDDEGNGDDDGDGEGEDDGVYDGIKPDRAGGVGVGVNFGGGEEGWRDVKLETVECEVPIKLWPGNTAFKAVDVVFDV